MNMQKCDLRGKVAIVTGATKGIGEAIANKLSSLGAKVVICSRTKVRSKHYFIQCNVSNSGDVKNLVSEVIKKFKKIDILVNNAGIFPSVELKDMTKEQWDQVININLNGIFNCTREVIPYMIKQKSGNIVNLSSIAGILGFDGLVHYCTTKAGVRGFTMASAIELAQYGIRVNAIAPGLIDTPGVRNLMDEKGIQGFVQQVPLKRHGVPNDIAETAAFLVSNSSSYITGQIIVVDGGYSIQ